MEPLPRFADYESVKSYLFALKNRGVKVGLERMTTLARILGQPQHRFPVVHVAGTNGKGSTSAMLEAIFRAAGLRTGLYTSPHLVHQSERIQVNRVPIAERSITEGVNRIHAAIEAAGGLGADDFPSFFEFMTGLAFLEFAGAPVDIGVIEVGLGGRLDATNVVLPEVAVITSIGYDHCEILGNTLAQIAREKAGIIKPGRPVVMGRLPPEAEEVVRAIAAERGSPLHCVREVFGESLEGYPLTSLEGTYQRWNAASALLASRLVAGRFGLDERCSREALRRVEWAGRWQRMRVRGGGLLVLDASHNPEGAETLDENLGRLVRETGMRPVVISGVLGEFRARALLPVVARHAERIHLVIPAQERASGFEVLEAALPDEARARTSRGAIAELFPTPGVCSVSDGVRPVVVTGSIYLLGEILQRLAQPALSGQEKLQDW